MYFVVQTNYAESRGIYRNVEGEYLGNIECNMANISPELWKINDEDSNNSESYLVQWDYKNTYYRISGKITEDEIKGIIVNLVY